MQFNGLNHPVHHVCFLQEDPISSITPLVDKYIPSHKVTFIVEQQTEEKTAIKHLLNSHGIETHFLRILSNSIEPQNDYQQMKNHLSTLKSQSGSVVINVASANKMIGHVVHRLALELELPVFIVETRRDRILFIQPQLSSDIPIADKMKLPHLLSLHDGLIKDQLNLQFDDRFAVKECFKAWLHHTHILSGALTYLNKVTAESKKLPNRVTPSISECRMPTLGPRIWEDLKHTGMVTDLQNGQYQFMNNEAQMMANGGWLEFITFELIKELRQELPYIQDIGYGVVVTRAKGNIKNELDVVFVANNKLYIIECKTKKYQSGESNSIIYQLEVLSDLLGGYSANGALVTLKPVNDMASNRAQELGIQIFGPELLPQLKTQLKEWIRQTNQ